MNRLQLQELVLVRCSGDPAHPVSRRQVFKTELHHKTLPSVSKALQHFGRWGAKIQITINIIFDQRNMVTGKQLHHFFFIFIRHTAAYRCVEVGNEQANADLTNDIFQGIHRYPRFRMNREFEHFKPPG